MFGQLEAACREWCEQVNARPHRESRRAPVEMLAEERARLHPLPTTPFTVAFGTTRRVSWDATVSSRGCATRCPTSWSTPGSGSASTPTTSWSPPSTRHWRGHGPGCGPVEVTRHARLTPGSPSIQAEHYPPATAAAIAYGERTRTPPARPRPSSSRSGPGAASWLVEAAAGARGVRRNDGRSRGVGQAAPARAGRPRARDGGAGMGADRKSPGGALLTLITPLTGSAPASSIRDTALHWSAFLSLRGSVGALRSFA